MSQISSEKNEFSPDECLPNFNLKFDFFERPKNPPDFALLGSREKKVLIKIVFCRQMTKFLAERSVIERVRDSNETKRVWRL